MRNTRAKSIIFWLIFTALIVVALLPARAGQQANGPVIRVLVIDNKVSVQLAIDDRYTVTSQDTKQVLLKGWELKTRMRTSRDGFRIGSKLLKATSVMIRTEGRYDLLVDGRSFRGDVEIVRKPNGRMMVINYVAIEEYLYGVLSHEVSHRWPMECLKAQAIAARTFALYQARVNKLQPYDVRSDVYSQVYGGKGNEQMATTKAVDATKGQVLSYKGDLFPGYFHATCAGSTEDATNLWKIDIPPLDGAKCEYCKDSKHYFWRKTIPLEEVGEALRQNGYSIGHVLTVRVIATNRSGRVDKLEIADDSGVAVIMTGKTFREIFGPNTVRSTKFKPSVRMDELYLDGMGWGHGVGLCQWGAYGMALAGKKADQILRHYYPSAEIVTFDRLKAQP